MINILIITTYIFLLSYVIRTIKNVLYHLFLWQVKEYRWDRMLAHLKTPIGKKWIAGTFSIIKSVLFFTLLITYPMLLANPLYNPSNIFHNIYGISLVLFWLIWLIETLLSIKGLIQKRWLMPKFTSKIIFILAVVLGFQFIFFFRGKYTSQLFWGIIMDRLLGVIVVFVVLISNIPLLILKKVIINIAKKKISKLKDLIVIGITGSYGKTSTKEFLAAILSEKFKVVKTPGFNNTDIGIANCILKELKPEHQVFVVEMGAYKIGEIKAICDIVKPKIGIITGINQQHLELFRSIENTQKAKFELIESLPKDGIAIFNGNNKYCLEMAKWTNTKSLNIFILKTSTDVKDIKVFPDHIEFNLIDKNKSFLLKINLLGKQAIENVLAAIYAANSLGMTWEEIKVGISKIVAPAKTMQLVGEKNGVKLIDDTFNANPDGVLAAVDYMKIFKGKKILVLTPLIELGVEAEKIHVSLGEEITKICDLILLTNFNYSKSFITGAKKVSSEAKIQIVNTSLGVKLIRDNLDKDGVVVFEGKEAGRILHQLTNDN